MSTNEKIGLRIKAERQRHGWSLARLSEETDTLSKSRISNYEQGIRKLGVEEAKELSAALGCTAGYLLGIEGETYPTKITTKTDKTNDKIAEETTTYNETKLWSLLDIYRTLSTDKREQLIDEALRLQARHEIEKNIRNKKSKKHA